MKNLDGLTSFSWRPMPPVEGLPAGPMWPEAEREAAARRVAIKRAIRRALRDAGVSAEVR